MRRGSYDEKHFVNILDSGIDTWVRDAVRNGAGKRRAVVLFDSFSAYVKAAAGPSGDGEEDNRSSRRTGDRAMKFTQVETFDDARNLALYGWAEGTRNIEKLSAVLSGAIHVGVPSVDLGLVGGAVDIPTYLTGEPECMWSFQDVRARKAVRIIVEGATEAQTSSSDIMARGAAIVSLVDAIEAAGIATEVEMRYTLAIWGDNRAQLQHRVTLKRADEPLDMATIAFATAHPSSLRRIAFGAYEAMSAYMRTTFSLYTSGGYGVVTDTEKSEVQDDEILVAGNMHAMYDRNAWIRATARSAGVDLE